MANKAKKSKIIVREIAPKAKVTEIEKEENEENQEFEAESLEEIATDAPSAREFPGVMQNAGPIPEQQARAEEVTATPAATTEAEGRNATRYQVQGNVTESEIRKAYDAPPRFERKEDSRDVLMPGSRGGISQSSLINPEIEAFRNSSSDESQRYEVNVESKPKTRQKYPWEA